MNPETGRPTQADLAKLIKAFGSDLTHFGPRKAEEIRALGMMFDLKFPSDYRQFLSSYGALAINDLKILGLADIEHPDLSAEAVTFMLRLTYEHMPLEVIPVEELGDGQYACLMCPERKKDETPVFIVDIENPVPIEQLSILAPGFRDYLYNRLLLMLEPSVPIQKNAQDIQKALKVFEEHVLKYDDQFQYDHATGGKLPRNHDWRPYRYCIQDVVFGITVVRHLRESNSLQVDVFLTAEVPEYDSLAGALALASFLLSEAYKCGGTMEIRFTKNVENGQVPQELQLLAGQYNIEFEQASLGRISPEEAKALYAALTNFSPPLREKTNQLEQAGRVKMARACYVVNHGVWTKEQVEMIVLGSEFPDSILGGMAQPNQWARYQHDLLHSRAALLAGMLERLLEQRIQEQDGIDFDLEDDRRHLEVTFDGELYAKRYLSQDPIPLPSGWLYGVDQEREIPERTPFHVFVRARDAADLQWHLKGDIQQTISHHQKTGNPTFILLPNDFHNLSSDKREKWVSMLQTGQVGLLICPDSVLTFDADAAQKLARSRVLRQ